MGKVTHLFSGTWEDMILEAYRVCSPLGNGLHVVVQDALTASFTRTGMRADIAMSAVLYIESNLLITRARMSNMDADEFLGQFKQLLHEHQLQLPHGKPRNV